MAPAPRTSVHVLLYPLDGVVNAVAVGGRKMRSCRPGARQSLNNRTRGGPRATDLES